MMDVFNSFSLTGVAANLTGALGVEAPKFAEAPNPFMKTLIEESPLLKETSRGRKVDRVLMYNPDAVALWLYQKYTEKYAPVVKNTQVAPKFLDKRDHPEKYAAPAAPAAAPAKPADPNAVRELYVEWKG